MSQGIGPSIVSAGLIKDLFRAGEWWRMITGIFVHGGMLHFFFNMSALTALGRQLEILGRRAVLFAVFLFSGLVGSVFSIVFMPDANSVGASGGLLGMIGFLAVLGIKRRKLLPPDYVKSILISTGLIGSMGILGYQLIDNAAHLGGFLTGAALAMLWVPNRPKRLPLQVPDYVNRLGVFAQYAIYAAAAMTVLLIISPIS